LDVGIPDTFVSIRRASLLADYVVAANADVRDLDVLFVGQPDSMTPLGRKGVGELAITGHMYSSDGWSHPPGTGLVGWVKTAGQSPVAYLQPGHGPAAYGNTAFRALLSNAIGWVASADAREWAKQNPFPLA